MTSQKSSPGSSKTGLAKPWHQLKRFHRAAIFTTEISGASQPPMKPMPYMPDPLRRPSEVELLVGDYGKAKRILGWEPSVSFQDLVRIMVDADMAYLQQQINNGSILG